MDFGLGIGSHLTQLCKRGKGAVRQLLWALFYYDVMEDEAITMRAFSIRCYHNSKTFEQEVREPFLAVARGYAPELREALVDVDLTVRQQLAILGIYARPEIFVQSPKTRPIPNFVAIPSGEGAGSVLADIDLGGFQMFLRLQELFPTIQPMRMTAADVEQYVAFGLNAIRSILMGAERRNRTPSSTCLSPQSKR